jgi:hypothetical protein
MSKRVTPFDPTAGLLKRRSVVRASRGRVADCCGGFGECDHVATPSTPRGSRFGRNGPAADKRMRLFWDRREAAQVRRVPSHAVRLVSPKSLRTDGRPQPPLAVKRIHCEQDVRLKADGRIPQRIAAGGDVRIAAPQRGLGNASIKARSPSIGILRSRISLRASSLHQRRRQAEARWPPTKTGFPQSRLASKSQKPLRHGHFALPVFAKKVQQAGVYDFEVAEATCRAAVARCQWRALGHPAVACHRVSPRADSDASREELPMSEGGLIGLGSA